MTDRRARLYTGHFVLLFCFNFLTFFAAFQLFPTAPLRLIELGATRGQSGTFMAVFTLASAFGALFTGPLGDRIGKRRMTLASTFLFTVFLAAYGLISGPWWWFCILALPHGFVWSGLLTATMSTLGGILPESRRAEGLTIYGLASPGGVIFGPMAGLAIFGKFGFGAMAYTLAALFLVLTLLAFSLPRDAHDRERRSALQMPEKIMIGPCSVLFATALGYGALGSYTAQEAIKLGFAMPSAFLSAMAVGMVGMRILMGLRGFSADPVKQLPATLWVAFVGLALLALAPTGLPRHIVSALLYGGGYSLVHTLISAHVLDIVHPERRGAAFGATLFSFDIGICLGTFAIGNFIGWAEQHWGMLGFRAGWGLAAMFAFTGIPLAKRLSSKTGVQIHS